MHTLNSYLFPFSVSWLMMQRNITTVETLFLACIRNNLKNNVCLGCLLLIWNSNMRKYFFSNISNPIQTIKYSTEHIEHSTFPESLWISLIVPTMSQIVNYNNEAENLTWWLSSKWTNSFITRGLSIWLHNPESANNNSNNKQSIKSSYVSWIKNKNKNTV